MTTRDIGTTVTLIRKKRKYDSRKLVESKKDKRKLGADAIGDESHFKFR